MTTLPSAFASRRVLNVMLHPTGHCEQIEAEASNSHGRAPNRKSAVVNAPTGQMSVVLPEKTESNPGSEREMICIERPRCSKPSTESPAVSSWKRMQRAHWMQRSQIG